MHGSYTHRMIAHRRSNDIPSLRDIPNLDQILLLGICRLVDFLQVASLQTYLVFQLQTFNASYSEASISWDVGLIQGSFTAAQCLTAIIWGRLADASWCGRKNVLLIGLICTGISCVGVAFSTSAIEIFLWRAFGGGMNGTVGIIRTMVSENIHEKRFQATAFLILPLSFSVAGLLGPLLGGFLVEFGQKYAEFHQNESGHPSAFPWLVTYPCSLPSLASALLMFTVSLGVFRNTKETLSTYKNRMPFRGYPWSYRGRETMTRALDSPLTPALDVEVELLLSSSDSEEKGYPKSPRLPFLRIFTKNVVFTFLSQAIFDFHLGAFAVLWPLFLSGPEIPNESLSARGSSSERVSQPVGEGLNMSAATLGISMAVLGAIGMAQQILLYRPVQARLGSTRCYRYFSVLFPLGYALIPGLLRLISHRAALWIGLAVVSCLLVTARTFTLPATIVLLNNCTPHPSVLGTVHGLGQSISAGSRTLGPIAGGYWYWHKLSNGLAGQAWWLIAIIAFFGWLATFMVREGSGHEIILEEDEQKVIL